MDLRNNDEAYVRVVLIDFLCCSSTFTSKFVSHPSVLEGTENCLKAY